MSERSASTATKPAPLASPQAALLQRKCACGAQSHGSEECLDCAKQRHTLQRKLTIGASNDPLETEADRVAEQVLAKPTHPGVGHAPLRIQRFPGYPTDRANSAPDSIGRTLAGSGKPLEPTLREDMERRFGYDFSEVRVHADSSAEQSTRDVNAKAYTVGHSVVFGSNQFVPASQEGRKLIAHELTHVVQQTGTSGIWTAGEQDRQTTLPVGGAMRPDGLSEHESRPLAGKSSPSPTSMSRRLQTSMGDRNVATTLQRYPTDKSSPRGSRAPSSSESVRALVDRLDTFLERGNHSLDRVNTDIREYMGRYDRAYDDVLRRLSAAQKEHLEKETEQERWKLALEFVVAVGVGLAGGELLAESKLLTKAVEALEEISPKGTEVAAELAKKTAEVGIVAKVSPHAEDEPDFGLPSEVSKDRNARNYLDQLSQAWRGMSLAGMAVSQFDRLVIHSAADFESASDDSRATRPTTARQDGRRPLNSKDLRPLDLALTAAERKLELFLGTVDTPVLKRTQLAIERDLWIRWISESEANARASQSDEGIAEHLSDIGVYKVLGDFSLTGSDYSELVGASKLQVERLSQLGRIGVVVLAPFWSPNRSHPLPGAVHVRADAYQAAGRREPVQGGARPYVAIEWQEESDLRVGDVVMLEDTSPHRMNMPNSHYDTYRTGGLLPKSLGFFLGVNAKERADALAFLGANASAYPRFGSAVVGEATDITMSPNRARPFVFDVHAAVEKQHAQPPLVVSESEEGVLVSEADGAGLALFTIYTSWGEAKQTQLRMGVRRIVAVALNPSNTFEDFADQGVVVTRHANFSAQISAARAELGRGPMVTVENRR